MKSLHVRPRKGGSSSNMSKSIKPLQIHHPHFTTGGFIEILIPPPKTLDLNPESGNLNILYEDQDLIVLVKPAGLVVHPSPGHDSGTMVNFLLDHCTDLSGIGGVTRPGIVHRLDKDTSGVMVAAKNDRTHQHLATQFKEHSVKRSYQALVWGKMKQKKEPLMLHWEDIR